MFKPIVVKKQNQPDSYFVVASVLREAYRQVCDLLVLGDKLRPSDWYDRLNEVYERLQEVDRLYACRCEKLGNTKKKEVTLRMAKKAKPKGGKGGKGKPC